MKKTSDNASWIARSPGDPSEQREQREQEVEAAILAKIKTQFEEQGVRVFYSGSFEGICSESQAFVTLLRLHRKGELEARAQVYCPAGELCWEGTNEQLMALESFHCGDCDQEIEHPVKSSTPIFVIPKSILRPDPQAEEIKRLRAALEQIANPTKGRLMKSASAIARAALEGK